MIRIGFLCGLLFCKSAADAVARVLIHGKASAVHGERVSRLFAPCLQQVFPKHIDRTREMRQRYRMHRSDERFFQDFFHLSPILSKRVDHACKILRRHRCVNKIIDQLIFDSLPHLRGKQFIRVLVHQKQNLAVPTELFYLTAEPEPLAQLPDALADDLHHQHIGTAGSARGKRFLRL